MWKIYLTSFANAPCSPLSPLMKLLCISGLPLFLTVPRASTWSRTQTRTPPGRTYVHAAGSVRRGPAVRPGPARKGAPRWRAGVPAALIDSIFTTFISSHLEVAVGNVRGIYGGSACGRQATSRKPGSMCACNKGVQHSARDGNSRSAVLKHKRYASFARAHSRSILVARTHSQPQHAPGRPSGMDGS